MPKSCMLFYDLSLGAWVRKPGSTSPPWMTPVLTIGSKFQLAVQFCKGGDIQDPGSDSWLAGLKVAGSFAGEYVASDAEPYQDGTNGQVFSLDLTTLEASAYFAENPTAATVNCAIQIAFTMLGDAKITAPLAVVLQNSYLQDP